MKRILTIFVLSLLCFLVINITLIKADCASLKDPSDDPPSGKKEGDKNPK
jgi:hypothetical protein